MSLRTASIILQIAIFSLLLWHSSQKSLASDTDSQKPFLTQEELREQMSWEETIWKQLTDLFPEHVKQTHLEAQEAQKKWEKLAQQKAGDLEDLKRDAVNRRISTGIPTWGTKQIKLKRTLPEFIGGKIIFRYRVDTENEAGFLKDGNWRFRNFVTVNWINLNTIELTEGPQGLYYAGQSYLISPTQILYKPVTSRLQPGSDKIIYQLGSDYENEKLNFNIVDYLEMEEEERLEIQRQMNYFQFKHFREQLQLQSNYFQSLFDTLKYIHKNKGRGEYVDPSAL